MRSRRYRNILFRALAAPCQHPLYSDESRYIFIPAISDGLPGLHIHPFQQLYVYKFGMRSRRLLLAFDGNYVKKTPGDQILGNILQGLDDNGFTRHDGSSSVLPLLLYSPEPNSGLANIELWPLPTDSVGSLLSWLTQ
jgi:hypothetical protein